VFNVADAAIVCGVVLLMVDSLLPRHGADGADTTLPGETTRR
jgi:lipoprotein signal peptidase